MLAAYIIPTQQTLTTKFGLKAGKVSPKSGHKIRSHITGFVTNSDNTRNPQHYTLSV